LLSLAITIYFGGAQEALFGQSVGNKIGGICFRVDDNQPIQSWKDYSNIFQKYKFSFSFALNPTFIQNNLDYINLINNLQSGGNELMDHTPDHRTNYFTYSNAISYLNVPGVDHINGDKVCLKYDENILGAYKIDGTVNINQNLVVSSMVGEFKDVDLSNTYAIYLPTLNKVFNISSVINNNSTDVDSFYIKSFWDEDVSLPTVNNVGYHLIGIFDLRMTDSALDLLFKRSLKLFNQTIVKQPTTWIQPGNSVGSGFPNLFAWEVKKHSFELNYSCAATYAPTYKNRALKCFNEYDPNGEKQYAMQWGDFDEENKSFVYLKHLIADGISRHFVLIGHSHFSARITGKWDEFLVRMDSLLSWCNGKNIHVKNYSEWADILYNQKSNSYENIIPPLQTDLDEDSLPDGFYYEPGYTDGTLDNSDGVTESSGKSFKIAKKGSIIWINMLGGVEKGENEFSIYTKGSHGDIIDVTFYFPSMGLSPITLKFPAENSVWTKYSTSQSINNVKNLVIPDSISTIDIQISCSTYKDGNVKISGMEMRKKIDQSLKIISLPDTVSWYNSEYHYQIESSSKFYGDTLSYILMQAPAWLRLDQSRTVSGHVPSKKGRYPITIVVRDQHFNVDSQMYYLTIKERKILTMSNGVISLGNIKSGVAKDTSVVLHNLGIDTISITSIHSSSSASLTIPTTVILPNRSINAALRFSSQRTGEVQEKIIIDSDADNSPDTIVVTATVYIPSDTGALDTAPHEFALYQNFPNPFNPSTTITYSLLYSSMVQLEVYDLLGKRIHTLINRQHKAQGTHYVVWSGTTDDGNIASSGVYFVRLIANPLMGGPSHIAVNKMIFMR
jgi:hypothetical protein